MKKNKMREKISKIVFAFICLFAVGITNVSALTVTDEGELRDAVDGVIDIEGVKFIDTDTTFVKLGADITLDSDLVIYTVTDLTIDLNGHVIDGHKNSKNITIRYGKSDSNITSAKLTIKDTGESAGAIKSYLPIGISYQGRVAESTKTYDLVIENGSFYSGSSMWSSRVFEVNNALANNNITFNFQVKDGYFYQDYDKGNLLFIPNDLTNDNVNINIDFQKLKLCSSSMNITLLYNSSLGLKLSDIINEESNVVIKNSSSLFESVTDLNILADSYTSLSSILDGYNSIEVIRKEGFDVSDVELNETYGYTTPTQKEISIKNRGKNELKLTNVSVSGNKFEIIGTSTPTISAGGTDKSYKIVAKAGVPAGTYNETITVKDEYENTYTANVKLIVNRIHIEGIGVSHENFEYGSPSTLVLYGLDDIDESVYEVKYALENSYDWFDTMPTKPGNYQVSVNIVDSNYDRVGAISTFIISPNSTEIKVIANSNTWEYDGSSHSDNGYTVYYGGNPLTTPDKLPTNDNISVDIEGSVIDVIDTGTQNNVVKNINIDNKEYYSNIVHENGSLTITAKTTPIIITPNSKEKDYDGTALTETGYTCTEGVLVSGDTLTITTGEGITYVGSKDNEVISVTVTRDGKDITDNYTFGTHNKGTLTVKPVSQNLSLSKQYLTIGSKLTTDELEQELTGAEGQVSFSIKSGSSVEFNDELYGGFLAKSLGISTITMTSTARDINGDGSNEYLLTTKDFEIEVVNKETVTISGITDNQEFTYDGSVKTPTGTLTVSGDKVAVSDLEVSYDGTGSTTYSSTTAPKNAGTYKVTYKVPSNNAKYAGEVTFNFIIKKLKLPKVTLKHSSYTYTGEKIYLELNGFDGLYMSLLGSFGEFIPMVKNAKTYNFSVLLTDKNNCEWTDGTTNDIPLTVSVIKANPSYEDLVPTNLTALKGQTLNDVTLPSGFTWVTGSTTLIIGKHSYSAKYTPSDTANYNIIDLEIEVDTKDLFNVTTSVTSGEGTINGPFNNVVEGSTKEILFTPEEGYMIDTVKVNGIVTTVNNNKLTLTVDENKDVKVSYKKIPLTITVVDTEGVTINPNGIVDLYYGDTKGFIITPIKGYRLIKVLVNDVDETEEMVDDKLTLNNITANMEIKVVVEKIDYDVVEGANQNYTITKDTEAKFRIDAEYEMFEDGGEVYVDDILLDEEYYTSTEGSTIITLKQNYLDTLEAGKHKLKVVFADGGSAETNFNIQRIEEKLDNPKTGDNIMLYILMSIISLGLLIPTTIKVVSIKRK